MKHSSIKTWIKCLSMAVGILIVTLGVSEWRLSRLEYKTANPTTSIETSINGDMCSPDLELGWILNPGFHPPSEDATEPEFVGLNRQRRSGPTAKCNKFPKKRVAIFGCSFTYGCGINDDDTYTWKLNERYPEIWFENYGVPGYSTYQCYKLMERVLLVHPHEYDVIIYAGIVDHVCRDFYDAYYETPNDVIARYTAYKEDSRIRRRLEVYRWPGDSILRTINYFKHRYVGYKSNRDLNVNTRGATPETFGKQMSDIVMNMQNLAEKHNARFLFACLDDRCNDAPEGTGWKTFESIYQHIKSQGTEFIDCSLPPENIPYESDPEYKNICSQLVNYNKAPCNHPNGRGNSIFAFHISTWIDKEFLCKGSTIVKLPTGPLPL